MNAPFPDIKYIHSLPFGSVSWMDAVISEEKRCCGQIDARISTLNGECIALCEEYVALEKQLETEQGFFARLRLTSKLRSIDNQLKWRHTSLDELLSARIARTYA